MPAELLRVTGVTKSYGAKVAVENLSFTLEGGSIAGLVGPNGCGKTTTLGMIGGVRTVDRGRIEVAGHDVATATIEAKRNLSLVPDNPRGFEQLTVLEYVDLYRSLYRRSRVRFREEVAVVLEAFGLSGHLDVGLGELSQGSRRKVALAAAWSARTPLLLIDEPTVGLDPESVVVLRRLVKHSSESGCAVLIASQDLDFAERACDHVLLMQAGRLIADGTPVRLCEHYQAAGLEDVFLKVTGLEKRIDDFERRLESFSS